MQKQQVWTQKDKRSEDAYLSKEYLVASRPAAVADPDVSRRLQPHLQSTRDTACQLLCTPAHDAWQMIHGNKKHCLMKQVLLKFTRPV